MSKIQYNVQCSVCGINLVAGKTAPPRQVKLPQGQGKCYNCNGKVAGTVNIPSEINTTPQNQSIPNEEGDWNSKFLKSLESISKISGSPSVLYDPPSELSGLEVKQWIEEHLNKHLASELDSKLQGLQLSLDTLNHRITSLETKMNSNSEPFQSSLLSLASTVNNSLQKISITAQTTKETVETTNQKIFQIQNGMTNLVKYVGDSVVSLQNQSSQLTSVVMTVQKNSEGLEENMKRLGILVEKLMDSNGEEHKQLVKRSDILDRNLQVTANLLDRLEQRHLGSKKNLQEKKTQKTQILPPKFLQVHPPNRHFECTLTSIPPGMTHVIKQDKQGFNLTSLENGKYMSKIEFKDEETVIHIDTFEVNLSEDDVSPNFKDLGATKLKLLFKHEDTILAGAKIFGKFHPHGAPLVELKGTVGVKGIKSMVFPPGKLEVTAKLDGRKVEHNLLLQKPKPVKTKQDSIKIRPTEITVYRSPIHALDETPHRNPDLTIGEQSAPYAGGRVHFSGGLMHFSLQNGSWSKVFSPDAMGEFVGAGRYPDNNKAFPISIRNTFDSIAIDAGTKVTIYEKSNFQGKILYEKVGPAIVCNKKWIDSFPDWSRSYCGQWEQPYETIFPQHVREFSTTDMHFWNSGSTIIDVGETIPDFAKNVSGYIGLDCQEKDKF